MPQSVIIGSGSAIAPNRVTNDMLARIMETSDEWIRARTGVETRYFVDPGTSTTDLGAGAASAALEASAVAPSDIDMVVFATMTPDHYFPGCGGLLQTRLGLRPVPCFDIRQQCSGFLYGLQLADAQIRAGAARTVLLVGAEVHSGFMPWSPSCWARLYGDADAAISEEEWAVNTKTRHLSVLFGDAAAAVVVQASDDPSRGVLDTQLGADGANADKLWVPGVGFARRPYVDQSQLDAIEYVPVMDGQAVFRMATAKMTEVARDLLSRNGIAPGDLRMVLMHQANRRINEFVQRALGIADDRVLHNIQKYANTTSATIPLLWDECLRTDRVRPGDLVLMVSFGAGMTWGAALVRA
jgi:3-oxoacyl-[acyl-carrier-protein] synthase-3